MIKKVLYLEEIFYNLHKFIEKETYLYNLKFLV